MPTLNWIGKDKIINHHQEVPYKVLDHEYGFSENEKTNTITDSGNLIINGDNLEALKSLLPKYEGKVNCIYIDPPYNTGNESWVYNDNVNSPKIKKWLGKVVGKESEDLTRHDKWLCMMYPRLKLLHKLLAKDGAIFISIDDNEQANLKLIMDEIFGGGNFISQISWRKTDNQANIGQIANVKEYIITYARNKNSISFSKVSLTDKAKKEYRYIDNKGNFRRDILFHKTRGKNYFNVITPNGNILNGPWMIKEEKFRKLEEEDKLYWASGKMETPYGKLYLESTEGQIPNDNLGIEVGSNQQASVNITNIFGKRIFDFPKPYTLIKYLLSFSTNKNSIILDSFAGSGTTAHAVLSLNKQDGGYRKFILIEMEDYAETITAERVKRVINGYADKEGTGGSFDYYTLGEPLFDEHNNLNETVGIEKIREYVWFTETRIPTPALPEGEGARTGKVYLGIHNDTAYYFIYEKDSLTTLDYESLADYVQQKAERYIIYADNCLLPETFMRAKNIEFKKIPRDITRF
ncbi:site-specific DNA-methyltransferase [Flavobacterium yafengii]|uniref:site-specific DNA-methyltransferase (adenine-specific) n=1 Tax=Flavobacterium yafengii TaxID=3041253 RepID=A0AAW6TIT1_9FLAO|nr:site-specific DNA-methyltransferase [Flavobacterium yafengii]MDI5898888.1 site-specific DNA-methyltransferase [Flavobacterium yafengii]MDI5948078.1 site-specific DNA-methyltransferase [Flavobacterium yafengii]